MNPVAFVPIDQVVATFNSLMEGADSIDTAFVKEWVYLGIQEIGPNISWYNECDIYPVDLTLQKPKDFHQAIDIALYDSGGCELAYVFRGKGRRIHKSDTALINEDVYAPELASPIDLSEDQYYYHLGSNANGVVASAVLKYWKLPTDVNGDLLIPENDVFPLALFCRYCYYMRKDDKQGIAFAKPIWIAARNEARGAHRTLSMLEAGEIARSWNTMIKKMRFRQF